MSMPVQNNSQYSLDEFEEIERLIQENIAPDSDEEEKETSTADSTSLKEPVMRSHAQVDTGYQTVADFDFAQESTDPDTTAQDDSRVSESESTISSKSSLRRTTNFKYHSKSSGENDDPPTERSVNEREMILVPTLTIPDEASEDESDDNKLVATFGTTENFEALLKQQLEDMDENFSDNDVPQQSNIKVQSQQMRHSTPAPATAKITFPRHRKIHNRTTRSPAANRVRTASLKSRTSKVRSHSPGLAESSDDLSVHSEASRNELRQRLRKAHSERKKETNITHQLQTDYDDLLTRFAEAENVIDQLRIGAKIDLFASLPNGGGEQPGSEKLAASFPVNGRPLISSSDFPARGTSSASTRSNSSRVPRTPRSSKDIDSMTENSLKVSAAASTEFLRIALEHQANELRGHMESFKTLLNEVDVADVEKRQVLGEIAKSLQKLEGDYIISGKDHEAEKRAIILSGNASGSEIGEFDPDRKIEGEIYQLRKMLDELRDSVLLGPSLPQTPASSRIFQSSDRESDACESGNSTLDLDAGFKEQLRRYNKMPLESDREDFTTASSRNISSDDDTTIGYPGDATPRKSSVSHDSSGMPERFLRPPSGNSTSPSKSIHHPPGSHVGTSPLRSTQHQSSPDESPDSRQRPRSRLPRPVEPRSQSTGVLPTKKPVSHEIDIDSGFVGSESSRQSVLTYPLKNDSNLQRLSPVHSTPHTQQPRPVPVQRKPSKQEAKQTKTGPRPVKTTKGPKISTGTMSGYSDREKIGYDDQDSSILPPRHEAPFYTPPKLFKQKPSRSEDGSSTWSSPLRPRSAISHGVSGDPMFSTVPARGHHYQQPAAATVTEKYRPSSRRSATSSSKDSTLDLIRGEIAKLRLEILENKAIADASQSKKLEMAPPRVYTSESQATESASQRGRRRTRTKDRRRGSRQSSRASEDSTNRSPEKTMKRDAKTGDDTPITTEQLTQTQYTNPIAHTSNALNGRWEYVPPYFSPSAAAPVRHMPMTYSSPVHTHTPLVQLDAPYYSPLRYSSPVRIYVPVSPSVPVVHNSIPVETRTYRRRGSGHLMQAAAQTVHIVDENDLPLTRSQLKPPKRSSSVPPLRQSFLDPQLSLSLHRAEKAAKSLRQKSRSMYKSLRDSYNRAELSSTFA